MKSQKNRLPALLTIGMLLIAGAYTAKKTVLAKRKPAAAVNPAATAQQREAEQELVRLHEAARTAPNDKQKQWDLANFYLKYEILDKAADQLAAIVHMDNKDYVAQLRLADVCLKAQQYKTAEFYYHAVSQAEPKNLDALHGLAASLYKQRRFYEATNVARTALEVDKNNPNSHLIFATCLLDYALQYPDPIMHSAEINLARREFEGLVKVLPNSGELYYQYGREEEALLQRETSVKLLERAHQLSPDNGEAARMLALAYRAMLRDDKALKVMQELDARQPNNPATNDMLGQLYLASTVPGDAQKAVACFQTAAKAAPNDVYIMERLGGALEKVKNDTSARAAYEKATQINPYRSLSFQRLALVYTRLGLTALAREAAANGKNMAFNEQQMKTIQELSSKHPDDANLHLILAERYREMKLLGPARDEYFSVLKIDPKNKRVPKEFVKGAAAEVEKGLY
jgi:tetratricopeptide (TPR) repeat protein